MVDSEYTTDNYKSSKISTGTVIQNLEMLKFVPDHLKTKEMCKHAVEKLPFVIRYVPDQYKTQQMYDKAILENSGTLESVCDYQKNQQMCDKAVENEPHALKFVPDCCKTQELVIKLLRDVFLHLFIFLIDIKLRKCMKELYLKILLCCPGRYKTQRIVIKLLMIVYQH